MSEQDQPMSEQDKPIMNVEEQSQQSPAKKKRGCMSRFFRFVIFLLLSPILLFVILSILLYVPAVQDWAVGIACEKLGEATGKDVKVDCLRLKFPLDVDLQQLVITQPDTVDHRVIHTDDTLLAVRHCLLDLDLSQVFHLDIGVDALDLEEGFVDSHTLIDQLVLKGHLSRFHADAHDLQIKRNHVNITAASLDGCDLDIAMRDTTIVDTTESEPINWTLDFSNVEVKDSRIAFHTANDTLSVRTGIKDMSLDKGSFDLGLNHLLLNGLDAEVDSVLYDLNYEPRQNGKPGAGRGGIDYNHLALYDIAADVPNVDYDLEASHLKASLDAFQVRERSGLEVKDLSADIELDTTHICISDAVLKTPSSRLSADVDLDWSALSSEGQDPSLASAINRGSFNARLSADFSKQDVLLLAGQYMPEVLRHNYPNRLLTAEVELNGNIDHVNVQSFRIIMPGMLDAKVSGAAGNLLNGKQLAADLAFDVRANDLSLVKRIAGISGFNLPPMTLTGTTHVNGDNYQANLTLRQGKGILKVNGKYNAKTDAYQALLDANRLVVSRFVKMDKSCVITAKAKAKGRGFDFLSGKSQLEALVNVPSAYYGKSNIGKVRLDAKLRGGHGSVNLYSNNDFVNADGCLEVQLRHSKVDSASFAFDVRGLDLYALGVSKKPLTLAMDMHLNGNSNLKDNHYVKGDVSGMQLTLADTIFYPKDINAEALLTPDTTYAFFSAGDAMFYLNSRDGLEALMKKATDFATAAQDEIVHRQFDQNHLTAMLPTADLTMKSGEENPINNILKNALGYSFRDLNVDLHVNPTSGINGQGHVFSFNTGTVVLDTITFVLAQDTITGFNFDARVCNGKKNKDVTFDSRLRANINPDSIEMALLFYDAKHVKGVDLGAQLAFSPEGMRVHLTPLRPILAYRYFTLNDDNYIELTKDNRVEANLDLVADDGTGLKLFSTPNEEAEQDLTASLNHFNIGELCSVIPYMPNITGFLGGDIHFVKSQKVMSVMADLLAQNLAYEGCAMGNVGVNAAYMPNEDGSHYVDGYLTQNDQEVLAFNGSYAEKGESNTIDANATLESFPVAMANGFLGDMMHLAGTLGGDLHVSGSTSKPIVDGYVLTDSLHVLSPMYSINLRVVDDSIHVDGSHLNLEKVKGYTTGANPLTLDGTINFANFDNILLDIRAKAKDFELINAAVNREASAYGKVYVDLDVRAKGSTNDLDVTGNLGVLGNTDVTYVLKDSPITVEDEMADLVTFCDFTDTVQDEKPVVVPPSNMSMRFNISIDQAAQVNCLLSEDDANYIKLEGGGDLTMYYNATKGLQLYGRYTILDGQMTYNLMVASLKDCTIANGSYVEFSGDVMNPRLNISASERVNSTITQNETPRSVAFDVGLTISQTLNNMGLEFTLSAPEDLSIQNEITQMTAEQRSRVAVTLMATGMYLTETQQSGGFNTTNALNSFLQSQISSITGKALSTIDLSLGVNNNQTASGNITTDYSFRFAKRFWGNRISLIVGGKVSSGKEAVNTGQSIINNVSIEYRLDKSATRYVTVYYDKDNESILEGQVTEMGAGLVLRKKTDRLSELFLFRKKKDEE